ncbi:hypothetical protein KKJ05_19650 [Xenorhabdus bovienii]|nr:hypothetical protein [Xenorhabdus bovienii]
MTPGQRYQLQALHHKGFPQYQIAEAIGVHPRSGGQYREYLT